MANELGMALGATRDADRQPHEVTRSEMLARLINADLFIRTKMTGKPHFEAEDVSRLGRVVAEYGIDTWDPEPL